MKVKKIPLRKCLGCNEMKPKKELIRIVRNKNGDMSVDLTGKAPGRGAYICNSISCFNKLRKTKGLNRAFQCEISDHIYETLTKELNKDAD